jgi:hypothetical protein
MIAECHAWRQERDRETGGLQGRRETCGHHWCGVSRLAHSARSLGGHTARHAVRAPGRCWAGAGQAGQLVRTGWFFFRLSTRGQAGRVMPLPASQTPLFRLTLPACSKNGVGTRAGRDGKRGVRVHDLRVHAQSVTPDADGLSMVLIIRASRHNSRRPFFLSFPTKRDSTQHP